MFYNLMEFIFYRSSSVLYANGTTVCYNLMEHQSVYILLAHQCIIFL